MADQIKRKTADTTGGEFMPLISNCIANGRLPITASSSGLDRIVTEGDTVLKLMQMEVKKLPLNERPNAQRDWESKNRLWQNTKRSLVMQSSPSDRLENDLQDPYHGKLLQGRKILEDTNQSVFRATQVAQENEAIGVEVMSELGVQRDALVRTRDRLQDANQDLTKTHTVLRSMNRRVLTNKCLLIVIILMELGILLALCYIKFIKNGKKN